MGAHRAIEDHITRTLPVTFTFVIPCAVRSVSLADSRNTWRPVPVSKISHSRIDCGTAMPSALAGPGDDFIILRPPSSHGQHRERDEEAAKRGFHHRCPSGCRDAVVSAGWSWAKNYNLCEARGKSTLARGDSSCSNMTNAPGLPGASTDRAHRPLDFVCVLPFPSLKFLL